MAFQRSVEQAPGEGYDVIIPLFNGLAFFRPCLESVLENTGEQHRILVVDDASDATDLLEYLESVAHGGRVLVLRNAENLGFVGSVNRGMAYSNRDVLLLNSDTVVSPGWLEKMDRAARSDPAVGTVTPWTNNGTICSFPHFCRDNDLPAGWSSATLSRLAERMCPGWYPRLPTAVGFCMLIRRVVLDRVGLFDPSFGRGYGEENEFCLRAQDAGFVHVLDDRTFVEHKGSMTFKAERAPSVARNIQLLSKMVPCYEALVAKFVFDDPLYALRRRMERVVEHQRGVAHVLLVLHDSPFAVAGTELHVRTLARELQRMNRFVPHLLVNDGNVMTVWEPRGEDEWLKHEKILPHDIVVGTWWSEEYLKSLEEVVSVFHIDLVHIHHLLNHPLQLPEMFRQLKVPVCFSVHDYYLACRSNNLIDADGRYCGDMRETRDCDSCLKRQYGLGKGAWKQRRQAVARWLPEIDVIFAPSVAAADVMTTEFSLPPGRIQVIPHGGVAMGMRTEHVPPPSRKLFRLVVVGNLAPNKGSRLLAEIIQENIKGVEWHVLGKLVDEDLASLAGQRCIAHGAYLPEELPARLESIQPHLAVFCSPWPETYCYVLDEVWANGIPALVGPMGALAERVRKTGGGWVAPLLSVDAYVKCIDQIRSDTQAWEQARNSLRTWQCPTTEEMATSYQDAYAKVLTKRVAEARPEKIPSKDWLIPRRDSVVQREGEAQQALARLRNTAKWRLLERIDRSPWVRWLAGVYRGR